MLLLDEEQDWPRFGFWIPFRACHALRNRVRFLTIPLRFTLAGAGGVWDNSVIVAGRRDQGDGRQT